MRYNHGVGVGVADASMVTGNLIHDQGQLGIGVWTRARCSATTSSRATAARATTPTGRRAERRFGRPPATLSHNYVHDNVGPGLWADGGNIDTSYTYNKITDNGSAGIQHEISYDATIMHNEVSGNGAAQGMGLGRGHRDPVLGRDNRLSRSRTTRWPTTPTASA